MPEDVLRQAVLDQFERALAMFRGSVRSFPAEQWYRGELDYLRPAGLAYHLVETIDFYAGELPADQFPWGGRFGVDWEDHRSEHLPSQEQLLCYLDEVVPKLKDWLLGTDLLSPERTFPWSGSSGLSRALYLLRHVQHHLAEMSLELRQRGYASPEWR